LAMQCSIALTALERIIRELLDEINVPQEA
jgi:hypothetical protein